MTKIPKCDIPDCGEDALYDEKTVNRSWAYLCQKHHESHGTGIGTRLEKRVKIDIPKTDNVPTVVIPLSVDSLCEVQCPHCKESRFVELDANYTVTCESCDNKFKVKSQI